MTTCRVCNRPLSDPESVRLGIGPVCRALTRVWEHAEDDGHQTIDLPWDPAAGDIVCRRDRVPAGWPQPLGGPLHFNIPQLIKLHSPTGFEWGYGGSGPADFALNILYWFTQDREFSERAHQDFKWSFISRMPDEGGTIPGHVIRSWITERQEQAVPALVQAAF